MHNEYHSITVENWNQTLRKSKAFHQSWAAAKIRALYDGQFCDQITKCNFEWKKHDQIELKEIVTLKLYTDFDKLQFELKKCFRWEYTQEVIEKNNPTPKSNGHHGNGSELDPDDDDEEDDDDLDEIKVDDDIVENEEEEKGNSQRRHLDRKNRNELQDRLQQFYHWRQSLVVILNKYGHKIRPSDSNDILYHGVNAKMILNPAITPAFYGPLSTSSSFHVAKTFATDKGILFFLWFFISMLPLVMYTKYDKAWY